VVRGRPQGQRQVAPMVVFGLAETENLYVEGIGWRVDYIPALLQAYPFGIARVDESRVAVVIDAKHECMTTRGVHKRGVSMVTSQMLGQFRRDPRTRTEFLRYINITGVH
jgi:hypothetical protein